MVVLNYKDVYSYEKDGFRFWGNDSLTLKVKHRQTVKIKGMWRYFWLADTDYRIAASTTSNCISSSSQCGDGVNGDDGSSDDDDSTLQLHRVLPVVNGAAEEKERPQQFRKRKPTRSSRSELEEIPPAISNLHLMREHSEFFGDKFRKVGTQGFEELAHSLIEEQDTWFRVQVLTAHGGAVPGPLNELTKSGTIVPGGPRKMVSTF